MLIDYLKKELHLRKRKNKHYSIRAFAKSLHVDSSTLAKVLAGTRKISYSFAKKIVDSLKVDEAVKSILLLNYADTKKIFYIDDDYLVPDEIISAKLMSKWQYYAILSYLEIDNHYNPTKLAKLFKTSESTVKDIVENFIQLEIVRLEKDRLILTGKILTAPSSFNTQSLLNVHKENIEQALLVLENKNVTHSDFSGITMTISSKKLKAAAERIKEFRRSLSSFLIDSESAEDSVYRINIQFFPLFVKNKTEK